MSDGFSFSEQAEAQRAAKARGPEGAKRVWCEECGRYVASADFAEGHGSTCVSSRDREIAALRRFCGR
jgi:hypothetical protein